MSSGKAFPPRLYLTATSLYNLNNGYSGNFNTVRENFGFGCDDTIYISMKEHSALIEAKDKEIERLRNFIVKVHKSSTCPATVLVAGQVLDGHDVTKEALAGGKDES